MNADQDALRRINAWLERLELQAGLLLAACEPEELSPAQAASTASKYITLIARLLTIRQQFRSEHNGDEEARLLRIIFGREA